MGLLLAARSASSQDEDQDVVADGHGGHGKYGGRATERLTREEIERYRRLRDSLERRVREHADALVGFVPPKAPPKAPDVAPQLPEPVARVSRSIPLGLVQAPPVEIGAVPAFDPVYARQQIELLRREIERIARAQAAAEAKLALEIMEAERIAARLRDEEDVLILLLAA